MIRLVGRIVLLIICVAFEFGFIHALGFPLSLTPLCLAVGVYFVFTLRPDLGLFWFIGGGFAADIQAMNPVGETLIGALVGALLVYVVQQHISHSSLYSVMILGGGSALLWLGLASGIRGLFGMVARMNFTMILTEAFLAMLLSAFFLLLFPWAQKRLGAYIRIRT